MDDSKIGFTDKLRLVCLYALRSVQAGWFELIVFVVVVRYENQKHQLPQFIKLLRDIAPSETDRRKVEVLVLLFLVLNLRLTSRSEI